MTLQFSLRENWIDGEISRYRSKFLEVPISDDDGGSPAVLFSLQQTEFLLQDSLQVW